MPFDLASSNVNRSYSLSATSIAIFTFTLIFLYPRYASGEVDGLIFQAALVVMAIATFALALASVNYYGASLESFDDRARGRYGRRADNLWFIGYQLLFLSPSLVLFAVGLQLVGAIWFVLWLGTLLWGVSNFPRLRTESPTEPKRPG
jgi:hypothetical protein